MYVLRNGNGEMKIKFNERNGKEVVLRLAGTFDIRNGKKVYRFKEDYTFEFNGFQLFIWNTDYLELS